MEVLVIVKMVDIKKIKYINSHMQNTNDAKV